MKLSLPQIQKVSLRRFSLYSANPDATFSCGEGVFCLVGANGLGKSTLLAAVNFGLTGIVADPNRSFKSMDEYYRHSREFSSKYFRGRIEPGDEDAAAITLEFRIGDRRYRLTRGMFDPDELREFAVFDETDASVFQTENMSARERHDEYRDSIKEDIGVSTFEEFVFLQHFVFTFDEHRRTILWNKDVLELALYRAFQIEPDMAKSVDILRREVDRQESNIRNRQFEATRVRRKINQMDSELKGVLDTKARFEDLAKEHQDLTERLDGQLLLVEQLADECQDANLRIAELTMQEASLKDQYAAFFNTNVAKRPRVAQHPLVVQSKAEHACRLCGNNSDDAIERLLVKASSGQCPLCDSAIVTEESIEFDAGALKEIDCELARTRQQLSEQIKHLNRLQRERDDARSLFSATKQAVDQFDKDNGAVLAMLRASDEKIRSDVALQAYKDQLASLEKEKDEAAEARNSAKADLHDLQKKLADSYYSAEMLFVPMFTKLADQFIGMPLDVELQIRETTGANLVVTLGGSARREQQQLSESQRFFLDIALRMTLTQHMSDPNSRGGMVIDTPEGSLDIAYEKRAGDMLAMFAENGHSILMTANLNSSQLLLALARRCGPEGITFCRMTDWSELSRVQQEEEGLFNSAYKAIEAALEGTAL